MSNRKRLSLYVPRRVMGITWVANGFVGIFEFIVFVSGVEVFAQVCCI